MVFFVLGVIVGGALGGDMVGTPTTICPVKEDEYDK